MGTDSPDQIRSGSALRERGIDAARATVLARLVEQAAAFPQLTIPALDTSALSPRDAAFAHALYDAVLRRWLTLRFLLKRFVTQPFDMLEPGVKAALLCGAAQIVLLDKVPIHAAIDETVEWAKRHIRPGAAGLVNAVLRKLAPAKDNMDATPWTPRADELPLVWGRLRLPSDWLPPDPSQSLSAATSHPVWLMQRWIKELGVSEAARIALHSLASPPITLCTRYAQGPIPEACVPHAHAGHHVFVGPRGELETLLAQRHDLWVQDAASTEAIESIRDLTPRVIVDACAGQGTKTRQLAACFPDARIIATDLDDARLATLRRVFAEHPRVQVVTIGELYNAVAKRADLVLLDVPCSNSGVLARRVEARYRIDQAQLDRMRAAQEALVRQAVSMLSPEGHILYSTCSLEREENDERIAWAERTFAMVASRARRALPSGGPGDDPTGYTDGSFSALLSHVP
ncbi:MAG: transcription antitermination factor NusB [Planctomycetota bacterium]|nr:transcription antitermination factor NusB [Planctomycetota bacterium]